MSLLIFNNPKRDIVSNRYGDPYKTQKEYTDSAAKLSLGSVGNEDFIEKQNDLDYYLEVEISTLNGMIADQDISDPDANSVIIDSVELGEPLFSITIYEENRREERIEKVKNKQDMIDAAKQLAEKKIQLMRDQILNTRRTFSEEVHVDEAERVAGILERAQFSAKKDPTQQAGAYVRDPENSLGSDKWLAYWRSLDTKD